MIIIFVFLIWFLLKLIKRFYKKIINKEKDNYYNINEKKREKKLYGFINKRNNCYLNSSLQLLTRIKDLKDKILNFKDICKDTITKGELIIEFQDILNKIDNDIIEIKPENLKTIMAEVDNKYKNNNQEDANEFISNFLNALLGETANKEIKIKKLEIDDKLERKAYDIFYQKFYIKKGYSFILDLFYGILKTQYYCKNCNKINSIIFNAYNMLELPIYELANQNKNLSLNFFTILNKYISEIKNKDDICKYCNSKEIYKNTSIFTLPKYLLIYFERVVGDEYIYNYIEYPLKFNFNNSINNNNKKLNYSNYILDCVIEYNVGAYFGHYTSLCPIDMDNTSWYRFSDTYFYKNNYDYKSNNSIILLYKSIDI